MFVAPKFTFSTVTGALVDETKPKAPRVLFWDRPENKVPKDLTFKTLSPQGRFKFEAHLAATEQARLQRVAEYEAEGLRQRTHVARLREKDNEVLEGHWIEIKELEEKQLAMEEAWKAPPKGDLGRDRMLRAADFRDTALALVDKLAAKAPRRIKSGVAKLDGLCYLRYFVQGRRWAVKMIWGRYAMSAWILWLLQDLWREDLEKVHTYASGEKMFHVVWCDRKKHTKEWHKLKLRWGTEWDQRVGSSRGRGGTRGRGATRGGRGGAREPVKLKDLRDSDKLTAALEDSRVKRVNEAWDTTETARHDQTVEWITVLEKEHLNATKAREEYDAYEATLKKLLLDAPEKRGKIIPAGWAKERMLVLARKFQDQYLNAGRREVRFSKIRETTDDITHWIRGGIWGEDDLFDLLKDAGFEIDRPTFDKSTFNTGERIQERDSAYWRTLVDDVLEEETSSTFFKMRIDWEYETDIYKARDVVKVLKLLNQQATADAPKTKAQLAMEFYTQELTNEDTPVIRREGGSLVDTLKAMETMTEWEDLAAIMCVRPRAREETKPRPVVITSTNINTVDKKLQELGKAIPREVTAGKAILRFAAPKKIETVVTALQWFTIEKLTEVNYSHFFGDPLAPLKSWTHTAAELCYREPGYHFLVQRICHRGNMAKDSSRDELAKALEADLGSKVLMKTMGSCKDWLWVTVDERETVVKRVQGTAAVKVNKTGASYIIRQFSTDRRLRHLLITMREGLPKRAEELIPVLNSYDARWEAVSAEPFSKMQYRVLFHIKDETTDWPWDFAWERDVGALYPKPTLPGSSPSVWGVKPHECQCCFNEDHSTIKCPLIDKAIDGFVLVPQRQATFVTGKNIPNSRSTEVWPPMAAPPPPPPAVRPSLKRSADWSNDEATRKRLRTDVETPSLSTPRGGTPFIVQTPMTQRVVRTVKQSLKDVDDLAKELDTMMENQEEEEDDLPSPSASYSNAGITSTPAAHQISLPSEPTLTEKLNQVARDESIKQMRLRYPYIRPACIDYCSDPKYNPSGNLATAMSCFFGSYNWFSNEKQMVPGTTDETKREFRQAFDQYAAAQKWPTARINKALGLPVLEEEPTPAA